MKYTFYLFFNLFLILYSFQFNKENKYVLLLHDFLNENAFDQLILIKEFLISKQINKDNLVVLLHKNPSNFKIITDQLSFSEIHQYGEENNSEFINDPIVSSSSLVDKINHYAYRYSVSYNKFENTLKDIKAFLGKYKDIVLLTTFPNLIASTLNNEIKSKELYYIIDCELFNHFTNNERLSINYNNSESINIIEKVYLVYNSLIADFSLWFINKQHQAKSTQAASLFNSNGKYISLLNSCSTNKVDVSVIYLIIFISFIVYVLILRKVLIWMFCSCSKQSKKKYN